MIYRIRTDLTGRQRLADTHAVQINVAGDWIYFFEEEYLYTGLGNLRKMRTDGTENQFLWKAEIPRGDYIVDIPIYEFIVHNDWIYMDIGYKIRTDGTELTNFITGELADVWFATFNIYDDRMYLIDGVDGSVYSIRLDGTDKFLFLNENGEPIRTGYRGIYLTEEWLFYHDHFYHFSMVPRDGIWR
jgi:hypothetical protein